VRPPADLDDLPDLHELIQTRGLGDELRNAEFFEQSLILTGPGGTPHANWNVAEMSGASNLAQDVLAGVLGQVQVQQDQVWNCRIRIWPLPADESECFAPVQQVNQFKTKILLLQRPIEEKDIGAVIFNNKNPGRWNNGTCPTSSSFHSS
jgi:hypothetical protein